MESSSMVNFQLFKQVLKRISVMSLLRGYLLVGEGPAARPHLVAVRPDGVASARRFVLLFYF